ncbi:unnamed protein product, partial [Prorocentrum cordatum]
MAGGRGDPGDLRRLVLKVTVEISQDQADVILVCEGEEPAALAAQFCARHGLREAFLGPLARHIQESLDKVARGEVVACDELAESPCDDLPGRRAPPGARRRRRRRARAGRAAPGGRARQAVAPRRLAPAGEPGGIHGRLYDEAAQRELKMRHLQSHYAGLKQQEEDREMTFSPNLEASQRRCPGSSRSVRDPEGLGAKMKLEMMRAEAEHEKLAQESLMFKPQLFSRLEAVASGREASSPGRSVSAGSVTVYDDRPRPSPSQADRPAGRDCATPSRARRLDSARSARSEELLARGEAWTPIADPPQ